LPELSLESAVAMPNVSVGRFAYDAVNDEWTLSEHLYRMLDIDPGTEVTTDLLLSRIHEDEREEAVRQLREASTGEGPFSGQHRVHTSDGRVRLMAHVGDASADANFSGYVIDLTELVKAAADEAVSGSAQHRAAIEQAKGALMLTYGISEEVAFHLLSGFSQNHNLRLRDVADQLTSRMTSSRYEHLGAKATLLQVMGDLETEGFPPATGG
jgi:hypothetical protein